MYGVYLVYILYLWGLNIEKEVFILFIKRGVLFVGFTKQKKFAEH